MSPCCSLADSRLASADAEPAARMAGGLLVNTTGMTLYTFDNDVPGSGKSACNGPCATLWPPLAARTPRPRATWTSSPATTAPGSGPTRASRSTCMRGQEGRRSHGRQLQGRLARRQEALAGSANSLNASPDERRSSPAFRACAAMRAGSSPTPTRRRPGAGHARARLARAISWRGAATCAPGCSAIMHNHVRRPAARARTPARGQRRRRAARTAATAAAGRRLECATSSASLQRLPPEQREVLLLVGVEEMGYQEVRRSLGCRSAP